MLQLRVSVPTALAGAVVDVLRDDPAVSALAVGQGTSLRPDGDVVTADVAREAADDVVERLLALDVQQVGTIELVPVETWVSRAGWEAEQLAPGASADSVVWPQVVLRAYDDTELTWTFFSFMTLATMLASIAIIVDSQVVVIGAMVLGPEFGAVAALGVALVRRRWRLLRRAALALLVGFVVAIALAAAAALLLRVAGWVTLDDVSGPRPGTDFIYRPDRWSIVVALIAGAAGVLSLTSSRLGGLTGVFISVTTIPAAGNVALGLAFGLPEEIGGSVLQLVVNITGMAVAGWLTLVVQQTVWRHASVRRARFTARFGRNAGHGPHAGPPRPRGRA
ncbi:DUF389 domain-containing protein [Cellulomonas fimi]|uniref:Integral membrane protein n=1 Tax=Cellulomonas fimi (strain ATCC 484 / DSM 20113 / JCM 1341 / CCUG 24087 / LMG 16345 / NBRC 15513 / NCIMB 8980 / NCTC 7547 / NRS-133) TaxID=590998 RepID=F4H3I3_CELFA|nr:DUF389 domain-containing protein [Cellulomonas fimi]AEE46528.1 protein of unknown function DUF389 [Cellulomonas fimi ATCC 484]NNH08744.1 DUF389 domain-containing protein [Cellulomonas fimi]VEH33358.1 uncharacterized hydrophobic domain [Cellulomonas fimi]